VAFDVAAFHYLLKPIEEDKFREVFRRAEREQEKRKSKQRETVFIKTRNRSFSLEKDSILYIIEIENSLDGSALSCGDSGLPISTKKDKEVHGIGLKNIRKCAVKYGGDSG
jgi:hypothetical protein